MQHEHSALVLENILPISLIRAILLMDQFGTKTSYFTTDPKVDEEIKLTGCKLVLFWFLARHGTRYGIDYI